MTDAKGGAAALTLAATEHRRALAGEVEPQMVVTVGLAGLFVVARRRAAIPLVETSKLLRQRK